MTHVCYDDCEDNCVLSGATDVETHLRLSGLVARKFHEAYERLAPVFNYTTRKESAVPWEDVPKNNRMLMTAVASEILLYLERPLCEDCGELHFKRPPFKPTRVTVPLEERECVVAGRPCHDHCPHMYREVEDAN
jgi:hypothetical protein